jgi:Spy/CpxP family protein refolding chaperone
MRSGFLFICIVFFHSVAFAQSPYSGEQHRSIKALSAERVAGLEAGQGLGYALPAELNGYPGPKHVLELADELSLSEGQRARTQALFDVMQERAAALGRQLVAAESELDQAFAERTVTPERLEQMAAASARLEGRLREVHLVAHLKQAELLDDRQRAEYARLRGYGSRGHAHHGEHEH